MIYFNGKFGEQALGATELTIFAILTLALPIVFYVLRTIGVFMLARKAKLRTAFMAFFPGLWIYPLTMLVKEVKFFKGTLGKWAIGFVIITTASLALTFLYEFLIYFV